LSQLFWFFTIIRLSLMIYFRYNICANRNTPCGTLGIANVHGMCNSIRSCNINQDIGLGSAFIIAHEMGHNFGMHHDGYEEGNECAKPIKNQIMAAQINAGAYPFTWSRCSRKSITDFLDSGSGWCLLNVPPHNDFSGAMDLAGRVHDADAQCRFIYGPHSRHCIYGNICAQLYCYQSNLKCITNGMPAAQGTACRLQKGVRGGISGVSDEWRWLTFLNQLFRIRFFHFRQKMSYFWDLRSFIKVQRHCPITPVPKSVRLQVQFILFK